MKRGNLLLLLVALGAAAITYIEARDAFARAYQQGYKDGIIDGSNSGFLEGQKSTDCPGDKPVLH